MLSIPPRQYKQQNAVLSVIWSMTQAIECNELKCLFFIWHLLTVLFIALRCDFDSYKIYFIFIFQWHTYSISVQLQNHQCLMTKKKNLFLLLKFRIPLDKYLLPMTTQNYAIIGRWQIFTCHVSHNFHHNDNIRQYTMSFHCHLICSFIFCI